MFTRLVRLLISVFACSAVLLGSTAFAASPFDGEWDVGVVVDRGECRQGYQVPIRISNGTVSYNGGVNATARGLVAGDGVVQLQFVYNQDRVTVSGKLRGSSGAGRWTSDTLRCSGRWESTKRYWGR